MPSMEIFRTQPLFAIETLAKRAAFFLTHDKQDVDYYRRTLDDDELLVLDTFDQLAEQFACDAAMKSHVGTKTTRFEVGKKYVCLVLEGYRWRSALAMVESRNGHLISFLVKDAPPHFNGNQMTGIDINGSESVQGEAFVCHSEHEVQP